MLIILSNAEIDRLGQRRSKREIEKEHTLSEAFRDIIRLEPECT
jgi:hypothetical protein